VPCLAVAVLGSTAGAASGAAHPDARLASLAARERSAALELYAAESSLARARTEADRLERRRLELESSLRRAQRHLATVSASLAATNERIATLLRRLYTDGQAEPIAVLLGARSLQGMLAGIDELERATLRNRGLAAQARAHTRLLQARLARLARARARLTSAEGRARDAVAARAAASDARRATIAQIRRRTHLTQARLAQLEARARAAQRASVRLSAEAPSRAMPSPAPPAAVPSSSSAASTSPLGPRTLVVDAVAYHLPGRTASGLPVGVGVIAVDPAVIPLGTRVSVPGYGAAVAADVGSAIRGAIIDLWMPSTEAARAWGRRTVTITVYG
jgi:3D (Asp-Asp-Asp) domain-containing protein